MKTWRRTKDEMPYPLEDVLFLTINGFIYLGWRSAKNIWYVLGSDLSSMNQPCEGAKLLDGEFRKWEIEVKSMEELLSMVDLGCNGIVIDKTTYLDYKYIITIYDDYLE